MNKKLIKQRLAEAQADRDRALDVYAIHVKQIALHLRAYRVCSGVSLRSVAKELNFTPPYISDVEHGKRGLNANLLDRYLSAVDRLGG